MSQPYTNLMYHTLIQAMMITSGKVCATYAVSLICNNIKEENLFSVRNGRVNNIFGHCVTIVVSHPHLSNNPVINKRHCTHKEK